MLNGVFLCDAIRTPIGRFGGALSSIRADDLATLPIRALIERNPSIDWRLLDDVFLGCANQAGEDNRNVARMAALLAGLPVTVPGTTINRLCASGMEAVGTAARAIASGELDLALAGGVESMSRAPFVMGKAEGAFQRAATLYDSTIGWRFINPKMQELHGVDSMPETAENVAREEQISREDQDLFAWRSQQRAAAAHARGYFAEEIVPVAVQQRNASRIVDQDEHPRADTTIEVLAKLRAIHAGGSITAGNSSGINDGAAAMIVASASMISRFGLRPQARILGMASAGVPPRVMGMGPVPATRKLLSRLGMSLDDFGVIELNEAFASQALACLRELGIPDDSPRVNPNGGAIAFGHPLGMSGTRLVLTAAHQLRASGCRFALATMCVGVGQGVAIALERTT